MSSKPEFEIGSARNGRLLIRREEILDPIAIGNPDGSSQKQAPELLIHVEEMRENPAEVVLILVAGGGPEETDHTMPMESFHRT